MAPAARKFHDRVSVVTDQASGGTPEAGNPVRLPDIKAAFMEGQAVGLMEAFHEGLDEERFPLSLHKAEDPAAFAVADVEVPFRRKGETARVPQVLGMDLHPEPGWHRQTGRGIRPKSGRREGKKKDA
jgi:hypothetical protein